MLNQLVIVYHSGLQVGYGTMRVTQVGRKNFTVVCSLGQSFKFSLQNLSGVCGTHHSFTAKLLTK